MPDDVIGSAFVEIRPDTSGFESALQSGLAGPIARLGNSVGGPLKAAVAGVAAVAGATIGVGVAAVDMAAKFDKSLSQIAANADIPKAAAEKIGDAFTQLKCWNWRGRRNQCVNFFESSGKILANQLTHFLRV